QRARIRKLELELELGMVAGCAGETCASTFDHRPAATELPADTIDEVEHRRLLEERLHFERQLADLGGDPARSVEIVECLVHALQPIACPGTPDERVRTLRITRRQVAQRPGPGLIRIEGALLAQRERSERGERD